MAFSLIGKGRRGGAAGSAAGGSPGAPRFAALAEVRAYWEGLRDGPALPRRDAIDPRGIAGALEQVFLIERIAPGVARFRLAGMQINDLLGMDARGMPLTTLLEPAARARLAAGMEAVFSDPAIVDLWLEGERGIGRPALEARMLLLPLVSNRGITDLALGCLAIEGKIGRVPRRFAMAGLLREPLPRQPMTGRPQPVLQHGMAEAAAPFASDAPRPPRGKPHLRLVTSDE